MKATRIGVVIVALSPLVGGAASAASIDDKASREVLAAMDRTSTWGHPDEQGEFQGMHYYASGNYARAMEGFLSGARYADKLSQLSIGLMYLNGEGVAKDPVKAYAWVALASERQYPAYLVTRDGIWNSLGEDQRAQAKALLDQLMPEYGDAVAKVRMERALRMARTEMTGSYVGYGSSATVQMTPAQFVANMGGGAAQRWKGALPPCGAKTIDGGPITGCGNSLYAQWRWDPREYFRVRDATWFGTVKVGNFEPGDTH